MDTANNPKISIYDKVLSVLADQKVELCFERELAGQEARHSPMPWGLHWKIREQLEMELTPLYSHQAAALEHILAGRSVCLATPTGSGKSRVFELAALQTIFSSSAHAATVLVLYPHKSLLPNQGDLWNEQLRPHGFEVGLLSGDVPASERESQLAHPIVLATADVVNSWFLSNARTTSDWLSRLRLVVIDDAHECDGVLGTHMAMLLRRLRAASGGHQVLLSCGALSGVRSFSCELIGAPCEVIERHEDGARRSARSVFGIEPPEDPSCRKPGPKAVLSDWTVSEQAAILAALANAGLRFIAYADLQPRGETVSREAQRAAGDLLIREVGQAEGAVDEERATILPYRTGREADDEKRIAAALSAGELRGVLATSAFELDVDLPEVDVVVLIDVPPLTKSFWQRIDRIGRGSCGAVIVLGPCQKVALHVERILAASLERNRLHLSSRPFLFFHALCAHLESSAFDRWSTAPFEGLPKEFFEYLAYYRQPSSAPRSFRVLGEINTNRDINWGR